MCGCNKNQTSDSVFDSLAAAGVNFRDKDVLGLGLFLVPAPENGILEYKEVIVEGLSYDECVKRGHICEAFQWIPVGVALTFAEGKSETIQSIEHFNDVRPQFCDESCRGGCQMGCHCRGNDTRCSRN